MSRLGRAVARLLPADRRDWAEAVWAEAQDVPRGWKRLAWRAGGVRLIAKEARLARRTAGPLLFAVAAGAAAWAAWPKSSVSLSHGGALDGDVIITLALLAGLPLLFGWRLGPPGTRAGRWLRAGVYVAVLAIMPAQAIDEAFAGSVPRGGLDLHTYDFVTQSTPVPGSASGGPDWGGEIVILLITAGFLAIVTALTARRVGVARATLAIGARAGLILGLLVFVSDPAGGKNIINPWVRETVPDMRMLVAWFALASGTVAAVAGALAVRRRRAPGDPGGASPGAEQGLAAGLLTGGVGAVTLVLLDMGTTALMIKSAWVRDWLYHWQHLTASATYGRELYATWDLTVDGVLCVLLPVIGLVMGALGVGLVSMTRPLAFGGAPPVPPESVP